MRNPVSSAVSRIRRFRRERRRSTGHVLRDWINATSLAIYPYAKVIFPNFRMVHYFYIITMSLLGSVIVFPLSSFKFIDILFLMSGACTQAGLNTINLNELKLLQQILIYAFTTLTTPIFIHSSLLFVRLYYFERHFDNIKESSKLNFKMRRNATLAARTNTVDSTRMNTVNNQGLGLAGNRSVAPAVEVEPDSLTSSNTVHKADSSDKEIRGTMYSEPSDDDEIDPLSRVPPSERQVNIAANDGIRFGNLPQPTKRRAEIEPSDMYKSIAMLQNNHHSAHKDSVVDDEVLVIKSPKEIERDQNTPIFTKRAQLHLGKAQKQSRKWKRKLNKNKNWTNLKKTLSNNPVQGLRRRSISLIISGDNDSIDSELHDTTDHTLANVTSKDEVTNNGISTDATRHHESEDDDDDFDDDEDAILDSDASAEIDSEVSAALDSDGSVVMNSDPGHEEIDISAIASTDAHDNYLNPMDTMERKTKIAEGPTVNRKKTMARARRRSKLRRWRTPMFTKIVSRSQTFGSFTNGTQDDADDDEEHYFSGEEHTLLRVMSTNYLSWVPTIGRNSTFVHLTDDQKEELGGVEYRAVKLLIKILVLFYVGFHVIAFCMFVGFIQVSPGYALKMRSVGISPLWWGFFTAQSTFNDLGFTLTPDSMSQFNRSIYVLAVSSFFIVIGNTGFPVFLRFLIWLIFKVSKPLSLFKESLGFLLDHPRRCFTLLFPSLPTWWLFSILVILNATDLILFIILDLKNSYLSAIPVGYRVLDGLFQAFSTRTAGFTVIDLSQLHPAVQVSYMIMMYISVLPLAISIRRTNVYEEQSLGIYLKADEEEQEGGTSKNFIGTHLRNQLSFDLWFIFLGLFIICVAEGGELDNNNYRFSVFAILFEIISAYGTVGLSLGYPNVNESLSYKFSTISKLVMIAMMIRGRHRGLPYALDRAIMLPDANMRRRDRVQESHAIHRAATLEAIPTRSTQNDMQSTGMAERLEGLRRTITRRASTYRKNSFFPAPTKLPPEEHEMTSTSDRRESFGNNYPLN